MESASNNRKISVRDMVYGCAIGDAMGVPFEGCTRGTFKCSSRMVGNGSHAVPAGTFSDDTSMVLATVDSIKACGRIDTDDMRSRFNAWMVHGDYAVDNKVFDIGCTTSMALRSGYGQIGVFTRGNGSIMRILPLAFTNCTDSEIMAVSAITHAEPICMEACVDLVRIARNIVRGANNRDCLGLKYRYILSMPSNTVYGNGFVSDTLEAALWCFARTNSFEECVKAAVNLGGDTDTTACIAGGLAGIYYGVDSRSEWYKDLRGKSVIESVLRNW